MLGDLESSVLPQKQQDGSKRRAAHSAPQQWIHPFTYTGADPDRVCGSAHPPRWGRAEPGKRTAARRGAPPRAAPALSAPSRPVPAPGAKRGLAAASAGECAASGSRTNGSGILAGTRCPGRKPGEEPHRFPIFISRNLREVMGSCDGECQAVSACCCSHLVGAKTTNLDFHRKNYNKLHINFFTRITQLREKALPQRKGRSTWIAWLQSMEQEPVQICWRGTRSSAPTHCCLDLLETVAEWRSFSNWCDSHKQF